MPRFFLFISILFLGFSSKASATLVLETNSYGHASAAAFELIDNNDIIINSTGDSPTLFLNGPVPTETKGTISMSSIGHLEWQNMETKHYSNREYTINGILPSTSMITFSYTAENLGANPYMASVGMKNSLGATELDYFYNDDFEPKDFSYYSQQSSLLLASAQMAEDGSLTMKVINKSSTETIFSSLLAINPDSKNHNIIASYNVSAVPLPAALPLFCFGLLGLFGYRFKRK